MHRALFLSTLCATVDAAYWTAWFSEEGTAQQWCGEDALLQGLQCKGSYCDNVRMYCNHPFLPQSNEHFQSEFFSEEGSGRGFCPTNTYVRGVQCKGRYCDSVKLHCFALPNTVWTSCGWTGWTTDGDPEIYTPSGAFVVGMECDGRYCDNMRMHYCFPEMACDAPRMDPTIDYSQCTNYKYGGTCTLRCKPGYTGSPAAGCQADKTWWYSGSCSQVAVDCGPPALTNADFSLCSSHLYGSSCGVRCANGYVGSPQAVCQANAQWRYEGVCTPGPVCPNGALAVSVECRGRNCAEVTFGCQSVTASSTATWWTGPFSSDDDLNNYRICRNDGFVTALQCSGAECSTIQLQCSQLDKMVHASCYWTVPYSENSGIMSAGASGFVAGVRCSGPNCGYLQYYLCQAVAAATPAALPTPATTGDEMLRFETFFRVPSYPSAWGPGTTDGAAPVFCPSNTLAGGLGCSGRYCDNMRFQCVESGFTHQNSGWTGWFSEEGSNSRICENNGFVTGLACSGDYCDNLNLRCSQLNNGGVRTACFWTSEISEEHTGMFRAPESMFIAGLKCGGRYCDSLQLYLCQAQAGSPQTDLEAAARMFAPRLYFDQAMSCFPSDPQAYYTGRRQGSSAKSLCNGDYGSVSRNTVPAFYTATYCGTNTIIVRYWFFWANQENCFFGQGGHAADWESLSVVIVDGELQRVLFWQHGGHYTRTLGSFQIVEGTHPVAFVGKISHGLYYNTGGNAVPCAYYSDYRNPGSADRHMDTWNNLMALRRGNGAAEWMNCANGCFDGITHPMEQTGGMQGMCGAAGCSDSSSDSCVKDCGCRDSNFQLPVVHDAKVSNVFAIVSLQTGGVLSAGEGGLVSSQNYNRRPHQRWWADTTADGYFILMLLRDGACLGVSGTSAEGISAALKVGQCNQKAEQQFKLRDLSQGYFMLESRLSGLCVEAEKDIHLILSASVKAAAQSPCNGGPSQRFRFGY